ncbi:MAG: hypothetical protein ACK6CU_14535, partial [Deltaproteobacteria bacterium]
LGGLAAGCAPGNPGLAIVGQQAPNDMCFWDPAGNLVVAEPVFDLDPLTPTLLDDMRTLGRGFGETRPLYRAQFAVVNNLINRFSTSYPVMADPNRVSITGAEVELLDRGGRRLPSGFYRTRASGTIPSALGDQPGRGLAAVDVIPQTVAAGLADRFVDTLEGDGLITARVVVIGTSQGGIEVRAAPYILPIQLCYGCLYRTPIAMEPLGGCSPGQDSSFVFRTFVRTRACSLDSPCVPDAINGELCILGHCERPPYE